MKTKATRKILLYGNSVILGTIGVSLGLYSQFEVTTVVTPPQELQNLDIVQMDIILFDLETTHPESVLSLLEMNSTIQLIGISPGINVVKVWSIRELREVSMGDLLEVIDSRAEHSTVGLDGNQV